jgi:hypothetical protein
MRLNPHPLRETAHTQVTRTLFELDAALLASLREQSRWKKITEVRVNALAVFVQLEKAPDDQLQQITVLARDLYSTAKKLNISRRKT